MQRLVRAGLAITSLWALGFAPSTTEAAGKYSLAYWHEIGAYQNQSPPAGGTGNAVAHIHVWNEDGTPREGARIYTSWGVLLGTTDLNGFYMLPLTLGYDFQIRDGSHLSDTTPIIDVRREPNYGHYSFELGFLFKSNQALPGTFNTNYVGRLNSSGDNPCLDLSSPGTLSLAYRSTPTNYCGDSYSLGNWVGEHGQTFVATGNRIVAAKAQPTLGAGEIMRFSAQILQGGPGGTPVGPPARSRIMVSDDYFPILVKWNAQDVQVIPGHTYYLKITREGGGLNAYQMGNTYPQGQYYQDGVAQPNKDLLGLVVCMDYVSSGPTGTFSGMVRDSQQSPLPGARIHLFPSGLYTLSESDGSYTLAHVPAGAYVVSAEMDGFISQSVEGVLLSESSTVPVDFQLTRQPAVNGAVHGLVLDSLEQPLAGVSVNLHTLNLVATTLEDGTFGMPSVPYGSYRVVASSPGFASEVQSDVLVTNGATTELEFRLTPQALRNANFEEGFSESIAAGWTPFTVTAGESAVYIEEGQTRLGGRRSQRWWTSYDTHHAGIFQLVPVHANSNYTFAAWTWRSDAWDNGSANQQTWVGVDPFGGTNANAPTLLWSAGEISWRTWTRQTVNFQAQAGKITLFVRGRGHFAGDAMISVVDDASLAGSSPVPLGVVAVPGNGSVDLSWYANALGARYNIKRAVTPVGPYVTLATNLVSTKFTDSTPVNGVTYFYAITASLGALEGPLSNPVEATPNAFLALVPFGSEWKYLDDGSNQGQAWRAWDFEDATWDSGRARLGYGGDNEVTIVGFGSDMDNKHVTTWFRHAFSVDDPSSFLGLRIQLVRDDGGIAYLNGTEVFRSNMPPGPVAWNTLASSSVGGGDEFVSFSTNAPSALLLTGTNVIAVEIHQSSVSSSDLGFDLELVAELPSRPPPLSWRRFRTFMALSWAEASGYVLQRTRTLGPEVSWTTLTSGETSFFVSFGDGPAFYRLARP